MNWLQRYSQSRNRRKSRRWRHRQSPRTASQRIGRPADWMSGIVQRNADEPTAVVATVTRVATVWHVENSILQGQSASLVFPRGIERKPRMVKRRADLHGPTRER